ncbi:hypothetical protein PoB_004843300 [Plakobranchus ocellatus]|uniref:Secreted protein n=1 Tax=Plakobranchus ocellatus TaxID=259542 RepID=A0AAV4BT13_9GAST|nr:hypothetical protein PoB_004843300 [Plakobranchus ocellatus]
MFRGTLSTALDLELVRRFCVFCPINRCCFSTFTRTFLVLRIVGDSSPESSRPGLPRSPVLVVDNGQAICSGASGHRNSFPSLFLHHLNFVRE